MKHSWSNRNLFLKPHIPDQISIIDFGCGNKEILDFCNPKNYTGIDIRDDADIVMDLNNPEIIQEKYDIGLILGLLEYLDNPSYTLKKIKHCANTFLILTCNSKKKKEWSQSFSCDQISGLVKEHFLETEIVLFNRYTLIIAKNFINNESSNP